MRILVTGSSGFVGQNLIPYLKNNIKGAEIISLSVRFDSDNIVEQGNIYIHLAGKAHDTKNKTQENEYYKANYLLTKSVYDTFLNDSSATCFIYMSSVKAIADNPGNNLVDEGYEEDVETIYGKSKRMAEEYILLHQRPDKRVYILRPCMIHGPGNKGNLNLLYQIVRKGLPYPLAAFDNKRSFLSIENLCFVINEMICRKDISSGIYHISDDEPFSTNTVIQIMSDSLGKTAKLIRIPKAIIKSIAAVGDRMPFPLNTERLKKLTDNYLVSNTKLKEALQKPLPISAMEGLRITVESFKNVS